MSSTIPLTGGLEWVAEEPTVLPIAPEPDDVIEIDLEPSQEPLQLIQPEVQVQPAAPSPAKSNGRLLAVGAAIFSVLLASAVFLRPSAPRSETVATATPSADAGTWLDSAAKSLERQDYAVAVTQYERALELLRGAPASGPTESAARKGLAQALEGAGELERAHALYSELDDPVAPEKLSTLSKQLRQKGEKMLADAGELRAAGDLKGAEVKAKEAFVLFSDYGGSPEQQASALEQLARIYIAGKRLMAAETELTKAQRLVFSKERQNLLATLTPPPMARPRRRPGSSATAEGAPTRPRLSLGGSGVPQAAKRARPQQQQAGESTGPRRRMKEIPIYKSGSESIEDEDVKLGERDVVQGYRTKRRREGSGVPGLR